MRHRPHALFLLAIAMLGAGAPAGARPPQPTRLERIKSFTDFPLIAVAVTPGGRIFASAPAATSGNRVIEIDPATGAVTPFPDAGWQAADAARDHRWFAPQALWIDDRGALWVLDSGRPTQPTSAPTGPARLVRFDLATNRVLRVYTFDGVVSDEDSLNDLRIDHRRGYAYLTNINRQGSLVVLNLATGQARQVLVGDRSTHADPAQHLRIGGRIGLLRSGKPPLVHADGIALSPDGQWLYYRSLTDHNYWRVPAVALADDRLSPQALAARVQFLGRGPITGGLVMARDGTLYGGDLEHGGIVALRLAGKAGPLRARTLPHTRTSIAWGDGFSIAGGYLYIADARLSETVFANHLPPRGPVAIYRLNLPARR
jgi:sugar lactone lactonase YvrE